MDYTESVKSYDGSKNLLPATPSPPRNQKQTCTHATVKSQLSASHPHTPCTLRVCVCIYLHMPLLHGAFRPHTYQLHSISCSSEADRLAGPCYITTLHSIYNSLCTKLMCTHTNTRKLHTYHGKNTTYLIIHTLNIKTMSDICT